jgi:hypothetical protein
MPLIEAPCRLCEINNSGTYGAATYSRVHVATTTRGQRPGVGGVADERLLSATLDVQPIQVPAAAYYPIGEYDRTELAEKVKF